MRLSEEMKMEFNDIKARLRSIHDGEYLDRSTGILGKYRNVIPENHIAEIFMGPLQIQEQGFIVY